MERDAALLLLNEQHTFPGSFQFRAIVRPEFRDQIVAAMTVAAGSGSSLSNVTEKRSSKGSYLALHVALNVACAEQVLAVYALLGEHDGVVTSL
jgi:putative lipoic acid-binding regulatory protein